ncbi:helix-turn-helix transcriptional regulator [Thiohalorhabdus sp. Cl-TMA]|uniref:Helix-turn-helix transcriptional regulator n=1 Tax=Thiohalorhabdus methylotrophus TaxID=3242694 RepID=A0ABV4TTF5_9GAMM
MPTPIEQAEKRVLRLREVSDRYGLSRSTVYRLMGQGKFPKPIQLGPQAVAWRVEDLEEWLASRPAAGED